MAATQPGNLSIDDVISAAREVQGAYLTLKAGCADQSYARSDGAWAQAGVLRVKLCEYEKALSGFYAGRSLSSLPEEQGDALSRLQVEISDVASYISDNYPAFREILEPL